MSCDLYFRPRSGSSNLTKEAFHSYFSNRLWFKCYEDTAWYRNEDTDVYFYFSLKKDADSGRAGEIASFNVNYFRPHFFATEACIEVEEFVKAFDFEAASALDGRTMRGGFDRDLFVEEWEIMNLAGSKLYIEETKSQPFSLPTKVLEEVWQWNYYRWSRVSENPNFFVPRIFFVEEEGVLRSSVTWGNYISILLPECEIVTLIQMNLKTKNIADLRRIDWDELKKHLSGFERKFDGLPYYRLESEKTTSWSKAPFRDTDSKLSRLTLVEYDKILDKETLKRSMDPSTLKMVKISNN